jgi:hypothetical protein
MVYLRRLQACQCSSRSYTSVKGEQEKNDQDESKAANTHSVWDGEGKGVKHRGLYKDC